MPVRSISERARKKLLSHARQVVRYSLMEDDERESMLDLIRSQFEMGGLPSTEAEGIVRILELHYRVDVLGGARRKDPILFHEPLI